MLKAIYMMLDFEKDYVLEDERVRLTPLTEKDGENLAHFPLQEPDLWTYSLMQPNTPEKMKAYLALAIAGRENKHSYAFIVYDKRKQAYAGSTRFYDIQPEHATLQLGYTWYGKSFQGSGLNQHCKFLLLNLAFETLQVERVEFRADADNQRSIRAMEKIGCTVEGILRSNTYKANGERRNSIVLSILKREWENGVKAMLQHQLG